MPVCFPRSSNGFRKSYRGRWWTFCLRTSQSSNMTICATEKLSWCWGRLPATMTEPDLIAEPLFDEPNVVVAGSESRWAKRRNLRLADLIGEPWVLAQPGSLARSLHEEVFRMSGVETPSATVVTVSLHLYMRMIETGRWLGLVPAYVMRFGGKHMHLKVLPVKTLSPPAPVGFITV